MLEGNVELGHETYAFWKDSVECSGSKCKIYTNSVEEYNKAVEMEKVQGWTNTEVIMKRSISDLNFVLTNESNKQNKTAEIYTSSIEDRVNNVKPNGILTYKNLYESGKITKAEYESTKGWSLGYGGASWSEIVGPVVGGISTYKAGKNGLLNQNTSNKLTQEKTITSDPYKGVKNASEYLQKEGVPRTYRKQILESFDIDSINMIKASDSTYGLRFYDNINAYEKGRYLFPSFDNSINRNGLALPYEWNNMTNLKQWKVEIDSVIIKGKVAPQIEFGSQYKGGAEQWYINNLNNLK